MERLRAKLAVAAKANLRLLEAVRLPDPSELERDAIIQRFEFTFEALWKAAQYYLFVVEGLDIASPKGVIRACREVGIFNEEESMLALKMADDRNLTVHTYNEVLAVAIYQRILKYQGLLVAWQERMEVKV